MSELRSEPTTMPGTAAPIEPGNAGVPLPVRVARISAGSGIVAAGIVMLVLPGPGLVAIAAGLGLLSKDVPAAARALQWVRRRIPGAQRIEQIPTRAVVTTMTGAVTVSVVATWLLMSRG